MKSGSAIVRSIWAACLLVAGANHAHILIQNGLLWDYGGVGRASTIYWSGLTLLDPLLAALLFVRPRIGIIGTILLIVTNVSHNLVVTALHAPPGEFMTRAANPFLISQIGFMLFVGVTFRIAWAGVPNANGRTHSGTIDETTEASEIR